MLKQISSKRNIILIIFVALLFVLLGLYLSLGNGNDKTTVLILLLILPFPVYGFVRLMFKVVRIYAPLKFIKLVLHFFLAVGTFGVVVNVAYFITDFPNGLSPALAACFSLIVAMSDEAKKDL